MPRKIPKWRQNRSVSNHATVKKKVAAIQSVGVDSKTIARLKQEAPSNELFALLNSLNLSQAQLIKLKGEPFPSSLDKVFTTSLVGSYGALANEIIWAVATLLPNGAKIKEFVKQRQRFELAVVSNNSSGAVDVLSDCQLQFGWSIWYMQNTLANAQYKDGVEEKRRLTSIYEKEVSHSPLLTIMLHFMAKRIEGTGVPGYLQSELANSYEGAAYNYLKAKIIDLSDADVDTLALVLNIDSKLSAIDHYESVISVLQTIVVIAELAATVASVLAHPIQKLFRLTADRRLVPILIAFGVVDPNLYKSADSKIKFIEAYSQGRYQEALTLAASHLSQHADDIGALVMLVRTEKKCNASTIKYEGVLGEVVQHLRNIISLSPDTYSSALSLFALYDRFFGHSWTAFLKGIVNLELETEKFDYPSVALRRTLVLEPTPTPFTALLQPAKGSEHHLISYFEKRKLFTSTIEVFRLATYGTSNNPSSISEERRRRYLGSYALNKGNLQEAIENFEWLITNLSEAESMRASAAAAIAYARCGQYLSSAESLVSGYLNWPHAPTVLPLHEIVSGLDLPENWPESICVPLIFELYTSFCSNDRMTHLRYAFERFHNEFNLSSPFELKERASEFGLGKVIYYLNSVWRPEVMRQTVLYEGTREIEEERIRVCQVLADIDSSNSLKYLAEIRERVKTLEIAKATNLVEQSKVYVDIAAIKKSLRNKLGDAYARYKSAAPSVAASDTKLMETISEALSQSGSDISVTRLMSSIHLIRKNTTTSELDLQFAAMFAEVTNEFLRGDHGLNAYLSTRVRHGKLSNALRKPAADEYLVTERKEGSTFYVPNYHWAQTLSGLDQEQHEQLSEVLEIFASTLDSIISHVKDDLIQVRVTHELVSKDTNHFALFAYQTTNLERMYMQANDATVKSLDEFIDLCVDTLWDKTDANLVLVQNVLRTEIRQKLSSAFDELNRSLYSLSFADRLGELINHVFRARTNTQAQLNNVTSWFKRSEVYDRQDYSIEFPMLVATNMIRNSISGARDWEGIDLNISEVQGLMPGRSLDAMVDMFCVLFENAIGHSGESLTNLKVSADLRFVDGCFNATLRNSVFNRTFAERDESRLQRIRAELTKDDNRNKAQKEGRSGFHKLWAIINAPQYWEPSLEFGFKDPAVFEVIVSFKTEVTNYENAYN
ncbi:hypothetical protein J3P95_24620 [Pseudomonas sp. Z5-35]|uniref:hypothetical protein n=1 Tax=Pseudomonas sp. Z5-35 TaxID=2817415 RepID=UPI003DA80DBE